MINQQNIDKRSMVGDTLLNTSVYRGGIGIISDAAYFNDIEKIEITRLQVAIGTTVGGTSPTLITKVMSFNDAQSPFVTGNGTVEYEDSSRDLTNNTALEISNSDGLPIATALPVQQSENNTDKKGVGIKTYLLFSGTPTSTEIAVKVYGRIFHKADV